MSAKYIYVRRKIASRTFCEIIFAEDTVAFSAVVPQEQAQSTEGVATELFFRQSPKRRIRVFISQSPTSISEIHLSSSADISNKRSTRPGKGKVSCLDLLPFCRSSPERLKTRDLFPRAKLDSRSLAQIIFGFTLFTRDRMLFCCFYF